MHLLITTPPLSVFEHMALDEGLVRGRPGKITLRFYHWTPGPAVTFGYAQFIREVRRQTAERTAFAGPLCRRPTGGGVVYHRDDLTFSLIFPSQDRPAEIYKHLHGAIAAALALSGFSTRVFDRKLPAAAYAPSQQHQANACFVNPVENDLLAPGGQKMLGGAIRRFGSTVLYQGSLQMPGARQNPACKQALINAVRSYTGVDLHIKPAENAWLAQAQTLAQTQYNTPAWTEKF